MTGKPKTTLSGSPQWCDGKPISGAQNLNKLFKGIRQAEKAARLRRGKPSK